MSEDLQVPDLATMLSVYEMTTLRTEIIFWGEIDICHPYFAEYLGSDGKLTYSCELKVYGPVVAKRRFSVCIACLGAIYRGLILIFQKFEFS